ncbi:unnamed protein product [Citrullus colocynthis]|uniref:Uncharacterized protein n=1 Tax=Citrullus colocynthis TaxID=252529 RepID=A0ABP0ZDA7_9ROSI
MIEMEETKSHVLHYAYSSPFIFHISNHVASIIPHDAAMESSEQRMKMKKSKSSRWEMSESPLSPGSDVLVLQFVQ